MDSQLFCATYEARSAIRRFIEPISANAASHTTVNGLPRSSGASLVCASRKALRCRKRLSYVRFSGYGPPVWAAR